MTNQNHNTTLFSIEFSLYHQTYYLVPLLTNVSSSISSNLIKNSNSMFKRIEDCLLITQKQFVQIGRTLIMFNPNGNGLKVECYFKEKPNPFRYSFNKKDTDISIGKNNCSIGIQDDNIKCILRYDNQTKCWVLTYHNRNTKDSRSIWVWSLINAKEEISDSMYIKIGKNVLQLYYI